MTVVNGGSKCNLITGYTEGEDNQVAYGKHKWLAQTFTLPATYVAWRIRFKSWTIAGGRFYEYAIRNTDISGMPIGLDISATGLSPTGESFYSPGKWRRFDFDAFPNLPAGTYALITRVPTCPNTTGYKLRCDKTAATYALGKAWESTDSGVTWNEIPGTDFMFEVWGWPPPPVSDPEPTRSNWAPLAMTKELEETGFKIIVTTDIPVHLFMRWTTTKPLTHPTELYRRGISLPNATRFCFVTWKENEQVEPGDTYTHTFIKYNWPVCQTRWFYFLGTKQAEESPSASPIFELHRTEVKTTSLVPDGDGDIIELYSSGLPHWQMVLYKDSTWYPPDGVHIYGHWEGNFIYKHWWPSIWQTDIFTFTNLPAGVPAIASLTVHGFCGNNAYAASWAYFALKTYGTIYYGERFQPGYEGVWYSSSWDKNPYTDLPWTRDEVNALQAGIRMHSGFSPGGFGMCDILKIEVAF